MLLILCILVVEESWVVILLHKFLRRLIDLHVSHSCGSFICGGFLCLLGLSLKLDVLELIKYVLVMQKGVRELVSKGFTFEESCDTTLNDWYLEQLVDCRSLGWVPL